MATAGRLDEQSPAALSVLDELQWPVDRPLVPAPPRVEGLHHVIDLEPLPEQIAEQPLELAIVFDGGSSAHAAGERPFQQRAGVDLLEGAVNRPSGGRTFDAGTFDPAGHAQPAAVLEPGFGAGDCLGHTSVVDRPFLLQA